MTGHHLIDQFPISRLETKKLTLSVVLCTYNRAAILRQIMECLCKQSVESDLYEILVVNNACTDNTDEVIAALQSSHPSRKIIRVYEERQGLAHSRNTGWKYAKGTYIAFLDDDCLPLRTWVQDLLDCFESVSPEPWSVGGPIYPIYDTPQPKWFKEEYEKWTWGEEARFLIQGESFFGGNMAFKKSVLESYGGFDTRVGMNGLYLSSGEETALYERIWQAAESSCLFYYCPKAVMYHRIPRYRMTLSYQLKRAFAEGQSDYRRRVPHSLYKRLLMLMRAIGGWFWHGSRAVSTTRPVPYIGNWFVEIGKVLAFQTGRVACGLGMRISVRGR